jgi:PII-like signaling protein
MQGVLLKLYTTELRRHQGMPVYHWLLEQAKKMGISGGSEFRAIAGYGRHGLHQEHFFELGDLPVEVEFLLTDDQAARFLQLLDDEQLSIFYVKMLAEFAVAGNL